MESIVHFFSQWSSFTIASVAFFVLQSTAVWSSYHALRHVRTSQAVVAWVVGLITLPLFALPLYWIFARHRFEGYREAIRDVGQRHKQSVAAVRRELETEKDSKSTRLITPLEQVADVLDTPICGGNQYRLLIDGEDFYNALIDQIHSAKKYVYAEFYIIRDDDTGNRFADALIERANNGVTVRLLYDEVGSLRLSYRYLSRLMEAGIDVRAFNTRQGVVNRFQINFRNHRKLLVVDGRCAIVGGLNVADEYLGRVDWVSHWRDTGVEIAGNLARKIQAVFAGDYYWAARSDLHEADWSDLSGSESNIVQGDSPEQFSAEQSLAAVCATGPADIRPRATMMFVAAANAAKSRLWISTPYLVPDEASVVALAMATARGVDVRLLIPSVADQWAVYLAGYYYERELADVGIPVYRLKDSLLHQKCLLVDDQLAMIGSTNLDNRSLYLNFELMVAIQDHDFVRQVTTMLEADFAASWHSNAPERPIRPWFSRAGTAVARLFSPVL